MVSSMTGFARVERVTSQGKIALELKTVNHRYLEINLRLPDSLRFAEAGLRAELQRCLSRGKVELLLQWQANDADAIGALNEQALAVLARQLREVTAVLPDSPLPDALAVLSWPGILAAKPPDEPTLQADVQVLLADGARELIANREREGAALKATIEQRLVEMARLVAELRVAEPHLRVFLQQKLAERVQKLQPVVSEERLTQELVMLSQRGDVAEELERLEAHIAETRDEPIGRRLDFLMQEFNREANTLGAKAAHTQYTQVAIDLKVLIEQMREQIQNIE